MTKEEQAIEYIKGYRKLDEKLYNTAPKGTVSSIATKKCLEFWDMAIKALEQQPCEDVISREAVIEWLKAKDIIKLSSQEETARKELKALPPVTPQKYGHWIWNFDKGYCKCSECGIGMGHKEFDYCPNCGCRMVEPQERSDKE